MSGCKYCTPESSWEVHSLGDENAISVDLGVNANLYGPPIMEIEIKYKDAGMDAVVVPIAFCPFCGRRLRDA